jgi:tetratricopeptide (TPR) repeat protein
MMFRSLSLAAVSALLWAVAPQCAMSQVDAPHNAFQQALTEFRAGHYSAAVTMFDRAEEGSPGKTEALLYKAKALIHLENFGEAERAVRIYLQSHRDSSDGLYLLGFVLHRQQRPRESLEVYTQAASISTPTGDDLKVVGLNYVLLDDYSDAIKWLEKAVEYDPKNRDAWYYLGRSYYTKSMLAEARKAFLKVLELNPEDAKAENNLGLIFETSGQPAAAIEAYQKAIAWEEKSEHPSEQPFVNLGNLFMQEGKSKEGLAALERAVAIAPENAFCRMKLGVAYREAGKLEDSRRELEKATQLAPDNPATHYQLGRLYKDMHLVDQAQAEFDRTAELQSRVAGSRSASPDR